MGQHMAENSFHILRGDIASAQAGDHGKNRRPMVQGIERGPDLAGEHPPQARGQIAINDRNLCRLFPEPPASNQRERA